MNRRSFFAGIAALLVAPAALRQRKRLKITVLPAPTENREYRIRYLGLRNLIDDGTMSATLHGQSR